MQLVAGVYCLLFLIEREMERYSKFVFERGTRFRVEPGE